MTASDYQSFIDSKSQLRGDFGFEPIFMPEWLFDFQRHILERSIRKGRSAIFADCGLGKGPMSLVWAQNVVMATNRPVIILAPLAVSYQFKIEAEKFGIDCDVSRDGRFSKKIVITNYQRLHYFNRDDFIGCVCDESGILKHFSATTQQSVTEFMKKMPYRLLGTATAAPNDYIELGTSSEALGELGYMDMLRRYLKNDQNTSDLNAKFLHHGGKRPNFRFIKHGEKPFWRWVSSWAISCRKPSDLGFDDGRFVLPALSENQHVIKSTRPLRGKLFVDEAVGLKEEREELRVTLQERCEKAAELCDQHEGQSVVWCTLNPEGDLLEKIIKDGVQVSGKQSDDVKEELLMAFARGEIKKLVTKGKIAQFGMNWQSCHHTVSFPSHSYETYYQTIRRFWRFGQLHEVTSDIVTTPALQRVLKNLKRKEEQTNKIFSEITKYMNDSIKVNAHTEYTKKEVTPSWLS